MPQTFLWWANPAVAVNEHYQSVFPPDVNAVFDHGKRAVSTFPVATGVYYNMDYSAGVDISNYKNIYVPTSYMVAHSTLPTIMSVPERSSGHGATVTSDVHGTGISPTRTDLTSN